VTTSNFLRKSENKYELEIVSSLDLSWNDFWDEASQEWDLIFSRDFKSINWRFFLNPDFYHFVVAKKSGKIIGYTVYRILPSNKGNKLVIADFLFLKSHKDAFEDCLIEIRKTAIKFNVNSINLWCDTNSIYNNIILKYGFLSSNIIPVIEYSSSFFNEMKEVNSIHFTISDTDNI
jgi:hypothetical protein